MYIVLTFTTRRYSEPDMRVFKSIDLNHFKNTRKNVMVSYIIRVYLGQITSGKLVGAQNQKRPNRDIKFSESQNN